MEGGRSYGYNQVEEGDGTRAMPRREIMQCFLPVLTCTSTLVYRGTYKHLEQLAGSRDSVMERKWKARTSLLLRRPGQVEVKLSETQICPKSCGNSRGLASPLKQPSPLLQNRKVGRRGVSCLCVVARGQEEEALL